MKIAELFAQKKTLLTYEVFPPKPTSPPDSIYRTIEGLRALSPDFISVTYGAAGGKNNQETFKIASTIKSYGINSAAHLPCIAMTREDVTEKLNELSAIGVENILALRGDLPQGEWRPGDFAHASDLIAFIRETTGSRFDIAAACYPEGHQEAASLVEDIRHLKLKVDAGADHLISQLFFDNAFFYAFLERCQLAGIDVPIEAGIMPVTNKKQIERMVSLCGASIPKKFAAVMDRYEDNPTALRDAGVAYAIDQIVDLIAQGVSGIHLYTMNNPEIARRIYDAVHNLVV